jgi:hypothetical protein
VSGPLAHGPAEVIGQLLIDLGLGTDPDADPAGEWPVYAPAEPAWAQGEDPDRLIFVTDTAGLDEGHSQYSGRRQDRYGGQVGVRAGTQSGDGWVRANAISVDLTERVDGAVVVLDGSRYKVHSVNADGPDRRLPPDRVTAAAEDPP